MKKSKTIEDVQEEWRGAVRDSMVQTVDLGSSPGKTLWLHFANSAVDFKGKFAGEALPLELFDCAAMQQEDVKQKFLKEGEMTGGAIWGPEFKIVLTSTFEKEDAVEFLADSIPLDKLKIINVIVE